MKPILAILIVSALASARAQQEPPIVPAQPLPPGGPKGLEKTINDTLRSALDVANEATANGFKVAQRAAAAAAKDAAAAARDAEVQLQDIHNTFVTTSGTSRGNRSLVITTSEPDPVANANAEEDLAIMSRILRKAVGSSKDDGGRVVLGATFDGSVFGSASGARNIYLDGYGTIFLLTVRYPLIGAPEKPEESKAKDTFSDEWRREKEAWEEETRPGGFGSAAGGFGQTWAWSGSGRTPAEDFDADKVEKLKTSLFEALKNATHIRALKPNDFVTVVVQGGEATRMESAKRKLSTVAVGKPVPAPADSDNKQAPGRAPVATIPTKSLRTRSTSLGETVMTIRVKKSDADAFAQGKLDLDAFRKKASVQTYFRRTDSTSASAFLPAVR